MRKLLSGVFIAAAIVMFAAAAHAGDVSFSFDIPTIPESPKIVSVSNSAPIAGTAVTVYANIAGQIQRSVCCNGVCTYQCEPNCDFSGCGLTDFYGVTDTRITPNPTCIPNTTDSSGGSATSACQKSAITNPKLFYYFLDDPSNAVGVGMTYDATTGNFKGEIPKSAMDLYAYGDGLAYYIIAADNRGNVVSQVPSTTDIPCVSSSLSAWVTSLATPAIDNCKVMNSYEQCGRYKAGTPTTCGTTSSQNDPVNDTCGSTGNIDASQDQLDIKGISAGVSATQVCAKIDLDAAAPDIGDNSTPISAYVMIFLNPDIVDPNPDDVYMTNATAITYAPGVAGVEPNLVSVLWNGECVTNPNTPDILGCKLIVGGGAETRLIINSSATLKSLLFMANNSLPNGKSIVGSTSKTVKALIGSGAIQLDGGTPFWLVDMTSGFAITQQNQSMTVLDPKDAPAPAAPLVGEVQTCVNGAGTSYPDGECAKAASQSSNICRLSVKPSPDAGTASEYRVYRSTTKSPSTAMANGVIKTFTSNLTSVNSYDDTISTLDGKIYYYYFSAYSSISTKETDPSKMGVSECTVEDWVAPDPPTAPSCATPAGNYGKCYCTWTADTASDPSLRKFKVLRDSDVVSDAVLAAGGVTNYDVTDDDSSLVLGQSYTYSISAIDAGNNESSAVTTTCAPEDLQAPDKVADFSAFNQTGVTTLDANITWDGVETEDADYYNIYKCANETQGVSCVNYPTNWTKVNTSAIDHAGAAAAHEYLITDVPDTGNQNFEGKYCFWVQACDNCATSGTCPTTAAANCSGFDTLPAYLVCIDITTVVDLLKPASPQNVVATPLDEGRACELTWTKVTKQSTGEDFSNPTNPTNMDLDKYAIMMAPLGETVGTNPFQIDPVGREPKSANPSFTHTGLSNGSYYQYQIIAYDSNGNYSPPQASDASCIPADIVAPDTPVPTVVIPDGDGSCDLSWTAVSDPEVVSYTIHRCADTAANCTDQDFPSNWGDGLAGTPYVDITDLELSDFSVDLSANSYTYCVSSKDPSGNDSGLFGVKTSATEATNCVVCSTAVVVPVDTYNAPSNVSVAPFVSPGDNMGIKVNYANSTSYAENGNTGGHNIYYCPDAGCASKTKINTSLLTTDYSSTTYDKENLGAAAGTYYIGVIYVTKDGVESSIAVSPMSVTVVAPICDAKMCLCEPKPASCNITINVSEKLLEKKTVACTSEADPTNCKTGVAKIVEAPIDGATLRVIDVTNGNASFGEITINSDGSVPAIQLDSDSVSPTSDYKVVLHIPADKYAGFYGLCENGAANVATEGCDILISASQKLNANQTITGAAKTIPKVKLLSGESSTDVFIGGGAEVGNANGDKKIGLGDLTAMKNAYNSVKGGTCYVPWADFNLDGKVGIADLGVLRANYNTVLPADATADAGIVPTLSSANPSQSQIPACCAAKNCP